MISDSKTRFSLKILILIWNLFLIKKLIRDFITVKKQYNTDGLTNIILEKVIKKIKAIPIPLTNMDDKLIQRFTSNWEYSVKTST